MTTKKKPGLEEAMARLESIVSDLEKGEHTLEESLQKFEEGLTLGKQCREVLEQAELRVKKLIDAGDDAEAASDDKKDDE